MVLSISNSNNTDRPDNRDEKKKSKTPASVHGMIAYEVRIKKQLKRNNRKKGMKKIIELHVRARRVRWGVEIGWERSELSKA